MRRPRSFGAIAALLLSFGDPCPGQQVESRPETRTAHWGILHKDGDTWYVGEDVIFRFGDIHIRCDTAVVWLAKKETSLLGEAAGAPDTRRGRLMVGFDRLVDEVYAEGNVLVRQGEEVHGCEAAFFDLVHQRGIIVDPRTRLPILTPTGEPATLALKADELRILSQTQMEAVGVQMSTCPFGNPHYHVASDKVEIHRARARERREQEPAAQTPSFYYTATGNWLYAGSGFPAIWVPDLAGDSSSPVGRTTRYVKDVRFGHSSQFGYEPGITLGDDLRSKDGEKWGSWLLDLDYLSKRGAGVGVDFAYEQPCFKGEIKANYQRDVGEDEFYGRPPTENRYRFSMRHRTRLPHEFQLDLETNVFSDRGYFPTYFEDELKQDKPPETYAYLKRAFQNSAVTGLFSTRVNDWETVNEYRPRLETLLVTEPLVDVFDNPLYLTARAELSRLKAVRDEDLHLPAISNVRADVDTLIEYPLRAGPVKVTPFGGIRTTYYEHDLLGNDDRTRTGFTYGAEVSARLWRNYPCRGGIFDLDGVRHIVEPSIEYRRTTGVHLHEDELYFHDDVDAFDDVETVMFELRSLVQTVRHRKGSPATVDEVFDLDLEMTYYPDARRDNDGDSWSNLCVDAVLRFGDDFQLLSDFEWNPSGRGFEEFNVAAGYVPGPEFQAYAGFRHFDDLYDLVYAQINWRVSEKWLARAYSSYDLERGEGVEHDLVLTRVGHDWVFSLTLQADLGENDFSVSIGVEPRILFDPILRPGGRRREPEFQSLGSWIRK